MRCVNIRAAMTLWVIEIALMRLFLSRGEKCQLRSFLDRMWLWAEGLVGVAPGLVLHLSPFRQRETAECSWPFLLSRITLLRLWYSVKTDICTLEKQQTSNRCSLNKIISNVSPFVFSLVKIPEIKYKTKQGGMNYLNAAIVSHRNKLQMQSVPFFVLRRRVVLCFVFFPPINNDFQNWSRCQ